MNRRERDNSGEVRVPPSNFNLIERAFRPTWDYKRIEGLRETVEKLHTQGRLRSALDEIFKALDKYPDHPEALRLAMLILGESRMRHLQAQEPLSQAYLLDNRLDPIFTVCSQCKTTIWVSTNCLTAGIVTGFMMVSDPAGLQCYNCGYVVCRSCLEKSSPPSEFSAAVRTCPNCHKDELHVPVYPTGRLPQQMPRSKTDILRILVFREGLIPPDDEYIEKLLEVYSPDALKNFRVPTTPIPLAPWPDDIEDLANTALTKLQEDGKLPALFRREASHIRDEYGTRVFLVKVFRPSPEDLKSDADQKKKIEEVVERVFAEVLREQAAKKQRQNFVKQLSGGWKSLFGGNRKQEEQIDLTHAGPLARSLGKCKKCDRVGMHIGFMNLLLPCGDSGKEHDHQSVAVSERSVIESYYKGSELAYLQDVDEVLASVPGFLKMNSQARLVRIECLERIAKLEGKIPSDAIQAHYYRAIKICAPALAFDLAAKELEKAVTLEPDNLRHQNQLAIQYFLADDWQKAEETWGEILSLHPDDADTIEQYSIALTRMAEKKPEQQIAYYKKALQFQPKSQRRYRDLGVAYQEAQRWLEAIEYLQSAITYATEPLEAASVGNFIAECKDRIASCYSNLGQYAEAVQYWKAALAEKNWSLDQKSAILSDIRKAQAKIKS